MLEKIDNWLLGRIDGVLEWVWAWTGVRRYQVLNVLLSIWAGINLADILDDEKVKVWFIVWWSFAFALMGLIRWAINRWEKTNTPEVFNGRQVRVRAGGFGRFFRTWGMGLYLLVFVLPDALLGLTDGMDYTRIAAFMAYIWLDDGLVPMGPRKKIKFPKLSLPKADVGPRPAYGGAWG